MSLLASEQGQAMPIAVCFLAVVLAFSGVLYHLGQAIITKIQLVNAVDAGAQAGGAMLATALNTIGRLNTIRLLLIHRLLFDRKIPSALERMASTAPYFALTAAVDTAVRNGADVALPLNFLGGCTLPDLEVRSNFFGIMKDRMRRSSQFPYGKRFVILGGVKRRPQAWFLNGFRGSLGMEADNGGLVFALSESAVHGNQLSDTYKATLVKLHINGVQGAIDRLKTEYQKSSAGASAGRDKA